MINWWDHAAALHKQVVAAQKASLRASGEMVKAQETGRKVIEANQRAIGQWARLWGIK